jgi:hypothetical protein
MVLYSEAKEQTMSQGSRDAVQDRMPTKSKQARKRQRRKLVTSRRHIPVSQMQTGRWRLLGDMGAGFSTVDTVQERRLAHHVTIRPTPTATISECGDEELLQHKVVRLEKVVHGLTSQLENKMAIMEERVARLEQLDLVLPSQSTPRKTPSYSTLSEIQASRSAWSTVLIGGQCGGVGTRREDDIGRSGHATKGHTELFVWVSRGRGGGRGGTHRIQPAQGNLLQAILCQFDNGLQKREIQETM